LYVAPGFNPGKSIRPCGYNPVKIDSPTKYNPARIDFQIII